jgi:glycosyltransferase involved in cell wall biosynthesis
LAPNGVDIESFAACEPDQQLKQELQIGSECVIGYVGSLVAYEGLDLLILAVRQLVDRGHRLRLLFVGDGVVRSDLERLVQEIGAGDIVTFVGRVPPSEAPRYYSLIDIAPFPRRPALVTDLISPLKPLEAMAMRKAVAVSSCAAMREMVKHGSTGLIFNAGDLASLTETLDALLSDPDRRRSLGEAGRRYVEQERTWKATASTIAAVHEELSAPRRRSVSA